MEQNLTITKDNSSQLVSGSDSIPVAVFVLLACMYGAVSICAVIGNMLVIIVVIRSPRLKSVTNLFICNTALADVLLAIFSVPFQFQGAVLDYWPLGEPLCIISPFFQIFTVSASVFTLIAIAFDRFCAIVRPLRRGDQIRKGAAKCIILVIWLTALLVALPNVFSYRVRDVYNISVLICHPTWTDSWPSGWKAYTCTAPLIQYLLPLLLLSYLYWRIGASIWWAETPGQALRARDAVVLKNKRKVVKTLALVVLLFALSWLPLQTFNFLLEIVNLGEDIQTPRIIYLCFNWLAMSNACHNPFIYGIVNKKYKQEFRRLFGQMCCPSGQSYQHNRTGDTVAGYTTWAMSERTCHHLQHHNAHRHLSQQPSNNQISFKGSSGCESTPSRAEGNILESQTLLTVVVNSNPQTTENCEQCTEKLSENCSDTI